MSGRPKNPERLYYEELFKSLDIPFIVRTSPNNNGGRLGVPYFINPLTNKSNDVTLVNLRRAIEQMIEADILAEELLYDSSDNIEQKIITTDHENKSNDEATYIEEKVESKNYYDNPTFSLLYQILKSHRGGSPIRILIYKDILDPITLQYIRETIIDRTYRVPNVGFAGFWDDITSYDLMENSETLRIPINEYTESDDKYSMEVFKVSDIIGGQPIIQHFNDGIKHCILYPIQEWAKGCYETSKSKSSKSRYNSKLKKINKLMIKYKDGVPETELQDICELLQVDIKVDLPLDISEPFLYCKSTKKRLKLFEFINTRLDHVDLNEVVLNEQINNLSRDEIYELKDSLDKKKEYYIYQKDLLGLSSITTFEGKYAINNEYLTIKNDFEEQTKLTYYKIDDILDKELSAFIKCATHYNLTVDFKDIYPFINKRKNEVKHIDQSKAYSNFHKCIWYEGFMGKITDFRKTDKIVSNGMYLVEVFNFENSHDNFKKYNEVLNIYCNNNIYGSPELKMLSSYGVTYTISAGCWGVKSIDFRFNDDMINKMDSDRNKYYAKWTGGCDQHNLEQSFYMKGDRDLFQNISNYVSQGTVRWVGVNEGCISYKKDRNYHLGHLTAQITMYMRMNMIEQLLTMNINNIIRVCVDGIYYLNDVDIKLFNVFRFKTDVNFNNNSGNKYSSNIYTELDNESIYDILHNNNNAISLSKKQSFFDNLADEREHFTKELHLGAGGTGKTHKVLTDKGLQRVLYVAPSRKLVRKKNFDYSITSDVLANLIINDNSKYEKIARYFNVLVLDEVSMFSEKNKKIIFERFTHHKLIFCGDIGYQLPTWGDEPITTDDFDKIYNHVINYRINCNELKKLCDLIRLLILDGIKKNCIEQSSYRNNINRKVENFFKKRGRMIDYDELKEKYEIKDYILVGTNEVGQEYTNMFKGKFKDENGLLEEKYYIHNNTNEHSNGDIVYGNVKPSNCNAEIRHHFTTHSIQGETIETKIFIDCSKMFDSRMFYTAISRARKLDQLYIIKNVVY